MKEISSNYIYNKESDRWLRKHAEVFIEVKDFDVHFLLWVVNDVMFTWDHKLSFGKKRLYESRNRAIMETVNKANRMLAAVYGRN